MSRALLLAAFVAVPLLFGCATTSSASSTATSPAPFAVKRSGKGQPVLFIPGLASSGEVWDETVAKLQGEYDCHVFTLAGFAGQPSVPSPFMPTMRRALAEYIRSQGLKKPIVVGHSLGGVLALGLAADAPDLVGGVFIVDSVPFLPALLYPGATAESSKPFADQFRVQARMQTVEQRNASSRQVLQIYISDEARREVAARWGADSDPETVTQAVYEMSITDLRPELSRITAPTQVLGSWIALQGRVPREAVEANYRGQYQNLPTVRLAMHDTARHFIMWDDPQGFLATLESFLKTTAASASMESQR
ncbi:alpha/beta hydrolase [Myxococcus sp. AM011]|uniref:alpha/beta fold hydrolase n=1 Tax=Myxococcus sp. AM011 TaxID=2745200 RepID=UPI001595BA3C|nr:alpha/beta hydrolase [Myxococcus sp. AM011]NVJ28047.1 alpha/beta hydrolase [Myxococcus sp. AM011]